jgi:hypothetical protein
MGRKGRQIRKALGLLPLLLLCATTLPALTAATELPQDITNNVDVDVQLDEGGRVIKEQSSDELPSTTLPNSDRPAGRWGTPVLPDNLNLHLENSSITDTSNGHVPFTAIPSMIVEGEESASDTSAHDSENDANSSTTTNTPSRRNVLQHSPPEGFHLSAHIITNPQDSLSYFANEPSDELDDELLVPFLECGAVGSTTPPIPLQQGHFRHFPKSAHPSHYMPAKEIMLLVALQPIEIQVSGNGEEIRTFQGGDVVLVEDMLSVGHLMRADPKSGQDLSVLILTLPGGHSHQHHQYHRQRERASSSSSSSTTFDSHHIKSIFGRGRTIFRQGTKKGTKEPPRPCTIDHDPAYSAIGLPPPSSYENDVGPLLGAFRSVSTRRVILTSLGVSLSTLTSYFLAKVAPLQLAVGIGGACVIGGGTLGVIKGGEWACDEFEIWRETSRLRAVEVEVEMEEDFEEDSSTSTSGNPAGAEHDLEDEDTTKTTSGRTTRNASVPESEWDETEEPTSTIALD